MEACGLIRLPMYGKKACSYDVRVIPATFNILQNINLAIKDNSSSDGKGVDAESSPNGSIDRNNFCHCDTHVIIFNCPR